MTTAAPITIEIPAALLEACEFYAEDTGMSVSEFAQLVLTQGLTEYTQARMDDGQRYFSEVNA